MSRLAPVLKSARVTLLPFAPAHFPAFAAMHRDPQVTEFLGAEPKSDAELGDEFAAFAGMWPLHGFGPWMVSDNEAGDIVGWVGFIQPFDWPEPELGCVFAQPSWGRGLASEAAHTAGTYAFAELGLQRIVGYINPANARSRALAERLGARAEGRLTLRGTERVVYVYPHPEAELSDRSGTPAVALPPSTPSP